MGRILQKFRRQDSGSAVIEACIVVPLFLSFGHHIAKDLPARMAAFASAHPDVNLITTAPIGADPLLCEIIQARIDASENV